MSSSNAITSDWNLSRPAQSRAVVRGRGHPSASWAMTGAEGGTDDAALLRRADTALYEAKRRSVAESPRQAWRHRTKANAMPHT